MAFIVSDFMYSFMTSSEDLLMCQIVFQLLVIYHLINWPSSASRNSFHSRQIQSWLWTTKLPKTTKSVYKNPCHTKKESLNSLSSNNFPSSLKRQYIKHNYKWIKCCITFWITHKPSYTWLDWMAFRQTRRAIHTKIIET